MGNDMDVCSKDTNLDAIFWAAHGPKDESSVQFFRRGYNKFCDSISAPKRKEYTEDDLQMTSQHYNMKDYYEILEFPVFSQDITLHACLWKRIKFHKKYKLKDDAPLCFIYMHTNSKSLVDALEISCLAHELDAYVLSFDLPGCGKSEGVLSGTIDQDVEHMIEWAQCIIDPKVRIILWARGMATAPAIQYAANVTTKEEEQEGGMFSYFTGGSSTKSKSSASSNNSKKSKDKIPPPSKIPTSKFTVSTINPATNCSIDYNYGKKQRDKPQDTAVIAMVLDSPFLGVKQVVTDGIEKFQGNGYIVPTSLIKMCSRVMISALASRLGGLDPFTIKPIDVADKAFIPCYMYSATEDDYIPQYHGDRMASVYGGHVERSTIKGKHFTDRSEFMILQCLDFLCSQSSDGGIVKVKEEVVVVVGSDSLKAQQAEMEDNSSSKSNGSSSYMVNDIKSNLEESNVILRDYDDGAYHDYFQDVVVGEVPLSSLDDSLLLDGGTEYEVKDFTEALNMPAADLPKNVSYTNLVAMAKSRSNGNLNHLGTTIGMKHQG